MNGIDPELIKIFVDEALELLDKLFIEIDALKNSTDDDRSQLLRGIMRRAHNLKGAAAPIGVDEISERCHKIESALEPYVESTEPIDSTIFDTIAGHLSSIEKLVQQVRQQSDNEEASALQQPLPDEELHNIANTTTMRVATRRFDHLMNFSGELLSSHARQVAHNHKLRLFIEELQTVATQEGNHVQGLKELLSSGRSLVQNSRNQTLDLGHLINSMNDAMKKLRMVPLRAAESDWRRIVRNAAQAEGKQISLDVQSANIELDKHVLSQLKDPMMHLLRNAVSHGIESPDRRAKFNKPTMGKIKIDARVIGANIELRLSDDGSGLNLDRILHVAERKKLLPTNPDEIRPCDIFELLFKPGFTTAQKLSQVSGRGVGLDVVRERVQALGGTVRIASSQPDMGTEFVLSVPLSILSTRGLFVTCCNTSYAIGVDDLKHAFRVHQENITKVEGRPVTNDADGNPLRLTFLSDILAQPRSKTLWHNVVVLTHQDKELGLVVDSVEGQQEYVTNSLPWNLKSIPAVNGAIVRPDGRLAVSLDIRHLFRQQGQTSAPLTSSTGKDSDSAIHEPGTRVLVVDDSPAARALGTSILTDGGYQVATAADGNEAMQNLLQQEFDLVISDVDMPNMDGLTLTRNIRKEPKLKDVPVILVTSRDSVDARKRGAEAGADEYVIKGSFDPQFLLNVVSKYV